MAGRGQPGQRSSCRMGGIEHEEIRGAVLQDVGHGVKEAMEVDRSHHGA